MQHEDRPVKSSDPFLDEIRAMKESVSAQFQHDVVKLCRALREEQEASGRRLIRRKRARTTSPEDSKRTSGP